MALADFQKLVEYLVRDDADRISNDERDDALAIAVDRYNKDRPKIAVEDLTAAGGHTLALPDGWQAGFSRIASIETPVGNIPPTVLENDAWWLYQAPAGEVIQLLVALGAGETVRVGYTQRHVLTAGEDTIPQGDREPVASWAAAHLMEQLASLYAGDVDPTIGAAQIGGQDRSQSYAQRARTYRKRYFDELGLDPKRNTAAGAVVDLDLKDSRKQPFLTHRNR